MGEDFCWGCSAKEPRIDQLEARGLKQKLRSCQSDSPRRAETRKLISSFFLPCSCHPTLPGDPAAPVRDSDASFLN
jgi:hypothetical protein